MARKKKPEYKFVPSMGLYRKREKGINDGKPVYGKTPEELDEKLAYLRKEAAAGIDSRNNPTVEQYVENGCSCMVSMCVRRPPMIMSTSFAGLLSLRSDS